MNWHLVVAVLVAGTAASFTDWLFMGLLFHSRYNTYPEVWRPEIRAGKDRSGILWATALGYISAGAIVMLCALASVHGLAGGLQLAALAWVAGPFLVIVVNGFFIKIDSRITLAHCLGYLVRFLIAGAAAAVALG